MTGGGGRFTLSHITMNPSCQPSHQSDSLHFGRIRLCQTTCLADAVLLPRFLFSNSELRRNNCNWTVYDSFKNVC